ncbi:MAG: DUF3465 domain-containing protein [Steroidobacteraceae bacterium]|nr:DUF3465 domain-containing protein [Steroidobacteraceae bacterium]
MRKILSILVVLGLGYFAVERWDTTAGFRHDAPISEPSIAEAFQNQKSDALVEGRGEVIRVLADDSDGSRHQRFILRLDSGQTLLIAHNIDLAPRLPQLKAGDLVEFLGEYEWNDRGGVIHWTHKDPQGQHQAGWLKYQGRTYQ